MTAMIKTRIIWIILLIIGVQPLSLLANDGAGYIVPGIGQARLEQSQHIDFVEETIIIADGVCQTDFLFRNSSSQRIETNLIFPMAGIPEPTGMTAMMEAPITDPDGIRALIQSTYGFTTWVNGERRERQIVPLQDDQAGRTHRVGPWAFVLPLVFEPGEEIRVENRYSFRPTSEGSYSSGHAEETYTYILETGATWRSPMERISLRWKINPTLVQGGYVINMGGTIVHEPRVTWFGPPGRLVQEGDELWFHWDFKNIRPDFNIGYEINHNPYFVTPQERRIAPFPPIVIGDGTYPGLLDKPEEMDRLLRGQAAQLIQWINYGGKMMCRNESYGSIFNEPHKSHWLDLIDLAINYHYARAGYVFRNPILTRYFITRKWYQPRPDFEMDLETWAAIAEWTVARELLLQGPRD